MEPQELEKLLQLKQMNNNKKELSSLDTNEESLPVGTFTRMAQNNQS